MIVVHTKYLAERLLDLYLCFFTVPAYTFSHILITVYSFY